MFKNSKKCIICEHLDAGKDFKQENLTKEQIFDGNIKHEYNFCYNHSIELFKIGQKKFLRYYATPILGTVFESNHPKFIELLHKNSKE
jgi:hypothetical protein